jgi:hypothetical protein
MINNHSHSWLWGDWEKIDYNRLKNKPTLSSWWVKILTFQRLASVWTWTQSFTWFWFTPTAFHVEAWFNWTATWDAAFKSGGYYDWTDVIAWNDSDLTSWRSFSNLIKVNISPSNFTEAQFSSFLSDWVELSFSASDDNILIAITCYS